MTTEIKPEGILPLSRPGGEQATSISTAVRAGGIIPGYARGGFTGAKQYYITDEFIRGVVLVLEHEYGRINGRFEPPAQELLDEIIAGEILRQREASKSSTERTPA